MVNTDGAATDGWLIFANNDTSDGSTKIESRSSGSLYPLAR